MTPFISGPPKLARRPRGSLSVSLGIVWLVVSLRPVDELVAELGAPLDAERILRVLSEHEVDYVLIGGLAVQTHGHVRTTNDADLIPAPEPANLKRLAEALSVLGAQVLNPGHENTNVDASMLPRATIWQFATQDGGVDVMHEVPGGEPYSALSRRALRVQLGDVEVPVVDLDDLIRMKLARGRAIDLADVAALTDSGAEGQGT